LALLKITRLKEKIMKTLLRIAPLMVVAVSAWALPPTTRAMVHTDFPHQTTKRDIQKLARTAESPAEHMKIANFYRAEADRFDALASGYESAAAKYRNGPYVKNLMTPPARFEFAAKGFRKEAEANYALAKSHEEMAREAAAGL
jgi:hypothetical protein